MDGLHQAVVELDDNSFRVRRYLRYVETYRAPASWNKLETAEISEIKKYIAPLAMPEGEDELARRFDYLIYSIDLGMLQSRRVKEPVRHVIQTAEQLAKEYGNEQVAAHKEIIEKVQTTDFWDSATIIELDEVRTAMRGLLSYLEKKRRKIYYTDFADTITDVKEGDPIYDRNDLQNYRKKIEFYLREHKDRPAVYKLRNNKPLTETDMKELEYILWHELGSKEDYRKEYGDTPIGRLVRKIVGVDKTALNEVFSEFLAEERLNLNQMRFVRLIVDYIAANGNIEDNQVLMGEPFRSVGSITALFQDDMGTARRIMDVVAEIKRNSEETA